MYMITALKITCTHIKIVVLMMSFWRYLLICHRCSTSTRRTQKAWHHRMISIISMCIMCFREGYHLLSNRPTFIGYSHIPVAKYLGWAYSTMTVLKLHTSDVIVPSSHFPFNFELFLPGDTVVGKHEVWHIVIITF